MRDRRLRRFNRLLLVIRIASSLGSADANRTLASRDRLAFTLYGLPSLIGNAFVAKMLDEFFGVAEEFVELG